MSEKIGVKQAEKSNQEKTFEKVFMREIEVKPEDPFSCDKLNRSTEIETLTRLFNSVETPFVCIIDSEWGSGKTTLVKMWEADLKLRNQKCLYFNAWKNDYIPDPFVAMLSEFEIQVANQSDNETLTKSWQKIKKAGLTIVKRGVPSIVKIATHGLIDFTPVVEDEIADSSADVSKDIIDAYIDQKNHVEEFKKSLSDYINKVCIDSKPLYIFIDELDRCRPLYSIECIEMIKHIINVPGALFVFSMDRQQLEKSICAVYGKDFDASRYLRRFYDFDYRMKEPDHDTYINYIAEKTSFSKQMTKREKFPELQYERRYFVNTVSLLAKEYKLTLRDVEQFMARISMILTCLPENRHLYAPLVSYLLLLRTNNEGMYVNGKCNCSGAGLVDTIVGLEERYSIKRRNDSHELMIIESMLYIVLRKKDEKLFSAKWSNLKNSLPAGDLEQISNSPHSRHFANMERFVNSHERTFRSVDIDDVVRMIEVITP